MLQLSVNGCAREAPSAPENWGELLNLLEIGEGGARQIVTAVRFGGVAVPTFREPTTLERDLQAVGLIDVETATLDDLLHQSARAAFDSIAPLKTATVRIAMRLREGHDLTAVRDLPGLTSSLQTLTTLTAALARARECVEPHRRDFDALVVRLCQLVDAVTERQVTADWNAVADVLERELGPTLDAWVLVARRVWSLA
ncbi:MAG: hypothetical protein ABL961_14430 [Vicinamibacterales bacterium]